MVVDFADLRRKMVDNQIRTVDVTDLDVLAAFLHVAREDFVPQERRDFAYLDSDIIVSEKHNDKWPPRTMMRPAALARLLQLAQISKNDKILDVGTLSGYTAALLSRLAAHVVALECDGHLTLKAVDILRRHHCDNVEVIEMALEEGYAQGAPYDVILCEGSADFVPPILLEQLRDNGRLVIVEGHGNSGEAKLYLKENDNISVRDVFNLSCPPLAGFQQRRGFIF